ncbi:MAG TPA: hypothetical protein VFE93_09925, partial [Myxococcaceae bacterium]|nr:hypothetical protein [Myxococcaceae bacterium]
WFNALRKRWREKAEKVFESFGKQEGVDREVLRNLLDVAPALGRYPAGLRELKSFRTAWYALTATQAKTRAA